MKRMIIDWATWKYHKKWRQDIFAKYPDPEEAHDWGLQTLERLQNNSFRSCVSWLTTVKTDRLAQEVMGLKFNVPGGIAAGFDKDARVIRALEALGFFVEVGTVTKHEQAGNDKPRIWRYPEQSALINALGFPSEGMLRVEKRVANLLYKKEYAPHNPLGINIGRSKVTSNDDAPQEYVYLINYLFGLGDYFVVNISSPNTPDLRKLQEGAEELLSRCKKAMQDNGQRFNQQKPLLVKISPDMNWEQLDKLLEVCEQIGIDGIIAANTTVHREWIDIDDIIIIPDRGGLSGCSLLFNRIILMVQHIRNLFPNMPLIFVGGIQTPKQAFAALAYANLFQIYTGFVYNGPFTMPWLYYGLLDLMNQYGIMNISEIRDSEI